MYCTHKKSTIGRTSQSSNKNIATITARALCATFVLLLLASVGSGADAISITLEEHFGGVTYSSAIKGNYTYIGQGGDFVVFDVNNRSEPKEIFRTVTDGVIRDINISGNYAYIANDRGLLIENISNPSKPILVGRYGNYEKSSSLAISGNYALVTKSIQGLDIIDISNPASPVIVTSYGDLDRIYGDIAISGNYAYVVNYSYDSYSRIDILSIADHSNPVLVGNYPISEYRVHIEISGNFLYLADENDGLFILDINVPETPVLMGSYTAFGVEDFSIFGDYAFVPNWGLEVLNISNSTNPTLEGTFNSIEGNHIALSENYSCITGNGLEIVDISDPTEPILLSTYEIVGEGLDAISVTVSENIAYPSNCFKLKFFNSSYIVIAM